MAVTQGDFVWYELMTSDTAAAEKFYAEVVGWTAQDAGMPVPYTIVSAGHTPIGGMMAMPEEVRAGGAPPHWIGYVGVDDVDATTVALTRAGGAVHRAAEDIPGVGRFAVVADPQGAAFTLFKSANAPPSPALSASAAGNVGWHELHTTDHGAAFPFYAALFGWTENGSVDMGPVGTYAMFATHGTQGGGMMKLMPPRTAPAWLYYFNVDAIEPATARVTAAGGTVLAGPHQVPGGSWIVQARDPQGAVFAIVQPPG